MIKKVDHIVITTADPAACLVFYEALGFTARKFGERYELFAGDFKINVHVKGAELLPHALYVNTGCNDFCFEISEDIEVYKRILEKRGLIIEMGIVQRVGTRGLMQSVYLRDPDGNLVELCKYE